MSPERWQALKEIFLDALDQEAGERPAFVARACAGDPELRRQVEGLLNDHERAASFIERPFLDIERAEPGRVEGPWPGRALGAYRILEEIGRGGMGAVYLARRSDDQYSQKVAIKLIRQGMANESLIARFRQERQILADLNHPGIARLLDGGTTPQGQPYLVMEYIEGEPIDIYCVDRRLSIDERLELFRKVCTAVHYAHQNLVIHRDIKPGNILVTASGEPKLLDFGTAKLLGPALDGSGVASTLPGLRLMTPEYASPEQLRGEPITTASDVYALGVVLYELLTGSQPFYFENRYSPDVPRIVCEQEPERPSVIVRSPDAARREPSEKLARRLRGDLDNIVLMALRKEPPRRYASAQQLSEDIRRHLTEIPVVACKDTWSYHLTKFVRRFQVAVTVVALACLAIVGAALAALWQARIAHQERERAELHLAEAREQRTRAEQVTKFLVGIFEASSPRVSSGAEFTAREILERSEAKIRNELGGQPEARATLLDAIGVVYRQIGLYERAGPLLEEALKLRAQTHGDRHFAMAVSWSHLGQLELDQGRYDAAEIWLQRALVLRQDLLGGEDPAVAASLDDLGRLRYARGDFAAAETLHREALESRRKSFGHRSHEVAESLNNVATALMGQGLSEEAEALLSEALAIFREIFERPHPDTATVLSNLAALLYGRGDYDAAEQLFREIVELDRQIYHGEHRQLADDLDNLAAVCLAQGRLEEAEDLFRQALAMRQEFVGPDHPDIAYSLNNLAVLMQDLERHDEAEELYRQALALRREHLGPEHHDVAVSLDNLARLLLKLGRHAEAEVLYRQALEIYREIPPDGQRSIAAIESELGECLTAVGRSPH